MTSESSTRVSPLHESALEYAERGLPVLPIHDVGQGHCSCSAGVNCTSPGKHPRTPHGVKDATTDVATIKTWWSRHPNANVGIATGQASGLLVLDVDPRHGGDETLEVLIRQHGPLPHTVEARTGGGGGHLFLRHPPQAVSSRSNIAPGLDVRADGGFVVAAPSQHISGEHYEWVVHPEEVDDLPPPPDWLLDRTVGDHRDQTDGSSESADLILEGGRNDTLTSLAGTLRSRGLSEEAMAAALLVVNSERCTPPLPEREVRRISQSIARYEPGPDQDGTLVANDAYVAIHTAGSWPASADEDAFYGLAGDFVRLVEPHSEADPMALLVPFLVAFGNVVGRGPHFVAEGDKHPTNLFAVLVGDTAKGRKGSSWGRVRSFFEGVDADWVGNRILSGLSSGEGLIWQVRDAIWKRERDKNGIYQDVISDPGVDDKRLLVVEPEFASVLRRLERDQNSLSPVMRDAWDQGNLQSLTKSSPGKATDALISILGHITKDEVCRYLSRTEAGNGFGNRFLWICTRRSKLLPDGGVVPEEQLELLTRKVIQAVEFARPVGVVRRDAEARLLWHEVYPQLSGGKPGLLGAMTARAEAQVMRLAETYALLDRLSEIRKEHLRAGLAVWRYAEASARYVFGTALGDPVADEILRALQGSPSGLSRTDIRDLFQRHKSKAVMGRALLLLADQGLAHSENIGTGGRPVEQWYAGATKALLATEAPAPGNRDATKATEAPEAPAPKAMATKAFLATEVIPPENRDATKATLATEALASDGPDLAEDDSQ